MCVEVSLIGRLGNNLFQYAIGRIIAEHLGLELHCHQIPLPAQWIAGMPLDFGNSATLTELSASFPNAPLQIAGRRFEEPVEKFEMSTGGGWAGYKIDLNSILQNPNPRQIRLRGYFQRMEYYAPYREKIRQWFRPKDVGLPYDVNAKDVLINIRRGVDYGLFGWTLPLSYYETVLSSLPELGQVYVCGTSIDDNVKARLAKYHPIYYEASPLEHFCFIMRFNRIVLSNSTFAWWAAYLSDAELIFAPQSASGYSFTGHDEIDLHMREDRYREIPITETVPFKLLDRNKSLHIRFDDKGRTLVIDKGSGRLCTIRVDDSNRELLDWLVMQDGPIEIREMYKRYRGPVFMKAVNEYIGAGLLVIRPAYADAS